MTNPSATILVRGDDAGVGIEYERDLMPLLRTYCLDCHGATDAEASISLAADATVEGVRENRSVWVRAMAQVRLGGMPPADGATMDAATRARMVELIDQIANDVDCVRNPNAGRVAMRRLNRVEYQNTIRDLTGVDYEPAADFPGDDVGYGFDNIGDVLSLPPVLMEKYLHAAEAIAGRAVYTPPPAQLYEVDRAPASLNGAEKFYGGRDLTMAADGEVFFEIEAPFRGDFEVTIAASGDQGGDEPVRMEVRIGRTRFKIDVPETNATDKSVSLPLSRGTHRIEIAFINDYYVAGRVDRNLHLHHVHVRGVEKRSPFASQPDLPPSHDAIVFMTPTSSVSIDDATLEVLGRFASRAFRRPVTSGERKRLAKLAASVREAGGSYEESIQVGMQAILVSPYFLFRVERPRVPHDDGSMPLINDYELATRISYFLWSSMPDDELLLLAHRGQLRDRGTLLEKVGRMIQDPRSSQLVDHFASQWLQLRNLDIVEPDTRIYRSFDDEIRRLMRIETLMFFSEVLKRNMPVTELIEAQFTYLNETLAEFYGVSGIRGPQFRYVSLAGTPRGGLLTHASVLTVTSNPTRTSPVKRGKWILDNLLNTPPPPAPPNVPELDAGRISGSVRERMKQHRANPACASCHSVMDPLGLALENFDAVGRWRTRDGAQAIDATGELPDGTRFDGIEDLRELFAGSKRDQFVRALSEKMLTYAIGRGTEYYDQCAIDRIVDSLAKHDYRFAYLIAAIIESDPFQKQGFRE
ncbi:MAG: DUF1592 domain-containing protein [Planctomycetota bacterium]